ncbi:MAG: serine O-acetyltransferase [Rhizobiales bacterium]|nr:serine O-acetyltransferase [Hyphomicrobiales bacterium]
MNKIASNKLSEKIHLEAVDPIWTEMRREAEQAVVREPSVAGMFYDVILNQVSLEDAVAARIATRLDSRDLSAASILATFRDAFADQPVLIEIVRADITAVYERDPACTRFIEPLLYFKGFHTLQAHRLAHWLWGQGRRDFALTIQSTVSERFQVDINPGVKLGRGIFLDHATGVVIGETAVIGDNVSILQNVTLGGTGKETGDRHPKIGSGVLIGAGATVLGNIKIGHCARIASGSVVLREVPPETTVAGVPARVVGQSGCSEPGRSMDQILTEKTEDSSGFDV